MFPRTFDTSLESTRNQETFCLGLATAIHALLLFWNPTLLTSNWQPQHDFVTVDVVEQGPLGGAPVEAPQKMTLMDTLKDMLMKPKSEEIVHQAPGPITPPAAAPIAQAPLLKEAARARAISPTFKPSAMEDDIAGSKGPDAIASTAKIASLPTGGPTLKAKSFGGIRAKDIPFQVGTEESINSGGAAVPIAVGTKSAKGALGYSSPTLQDAGKTRVGLGGALTNRSRGEEMNAIGAGGSGPSPIALSGTGGNGTAPTNLGAGTGSLTERRGGGLVGAALTGRRGTYVGGSGTGLSTEGMPSAARELESQMNQAASRTQSKPANKGFEIAGPLTNRPILKKVIPQYPDWAESQGIVGSVRLYFTVTPEGKVRPNITVTKTTGYPQLDQLAVDALKQWQFKPLDAGEEGRGEWGIITFNFSLSS